MNGLPGYDDWKLENPHDITVEQEAEMIERDIEQKANLRECIAATLKDERGDIYLADIREIVIEELNKLRPQAGEPRWQTATPVPVPGLG